MQTSTCDKGMRLMHGGHTSAIRWAGGMLALWLAGIPAWAGEGRIEISPFHIPYTITNSGSYLLTGNIRVTSTNQSAITVAANDVTLDLNGFVVEGPGTISVSGISQLSSYRNLAVRNGTVKRWGSLMAAGIRAAGQNSVVERVTAYSNSIGIYGGQGCLIRFCSVFSNSYEGITVNEQAVVETCTAGGNTGWGIHAQQGGTINGCLSPFNGGGIYVHKGGQIRECSALASLLGNNIQAMAGSAIYGCIAMGATNSGIYAEGGDCVISYCFTLLNLNHGINADDHTLIENCVSLENHNAGIAVGDGNQVRHCTVYTNGQDGITAEDNNVILENLCYRQEKPGSGIHITGSGNRLEGNHCADNWRGFFVDNHPNLIVKNSAVYSTEMNFNIEAGNTTGDIETNTAPWQKPWANFYIDD